MIVKFKVGPAKLKAVKAIMNNLTDQKLRLAKAMADEGVIVCDEVTCAPTINALREAGCTEFKTINSVELGLFQVFLKDWA